MAFLPKNVGIYSVGLLGGSLGLALKQSGFPGRIIGYSAPKTLTTALEVGCIDQGFSYDSIQDTIGEIDVLFLCSPINTIKKCIERLSSINLPDNLTITDVGSTKKEIVECARNVLPSNVHFIGGHPMAGSEKSGPSAADPYLFQNALYVLTPPNGKPSAIDNSFAEFLQGNLGCRYLFLDPSTHDHIAAAVSHIPHLLAVALVCMAEDVEQSIPGALNLAAGGFRDMTRIASAPYDVWHDILSTNKQTIAPLLDLLIEKLQTIRKELITDNLKEIFTLAQNVRTRIPSSNKGFMSSLSEVLVRVKDQPGIIASISGSLSAEDINIKDIEVVKVREGEGGTIRLAFESIEKAHQAIAVLTKQGFSARERI